MIRIYTCTILTFLDISVFMNIHNNTIQKCYIWRYYLKMTVTDIHVKMMVRCQRTVLYFVTNTLNLHKKAKYVYTCAVVASFDNCLSNLCQTKMYCTLQLSCFTYKKNYKCDIMMSHVYSTCLQHVRPINRLDHCVPPLFFFKLYSKLM